MPTPDLTAVLTPGGPIPPDRAASLRRLADYIRGRRAAGTPARLLTICTHNSRRSHFAQVMLAVAADHYGLDGVETYSGGTEATALHPHAVAALRRFGFRVDAEAAGGDNPIYQIRWRDDRPPYRAWSKVYTAPPNPAAGFAAILVCGAADAGCPTVAGADLRVALPYDDPKAADGTDRVAETYDARLLTIGREMFEVVRLATPRT